MTGIKKMPIQINLRLSTYLNFVCPISNTDPLIKNEEKRTEREKKRTQPNTKNKHNGFLGFIHQNVIF